MKARRSGTCGLCHGPIMVGQPIAKATVWAHVQCVIEPRHRHLREHSMTGPIVYRCACGGLTGLMRDGDSVALFGVDRDEDGATWWCQACCLNLTHRRPDDLCTHLLALLACPT